MLLNIDNIKVSYGSFLAIKGISVKVEQGEVVCILGANGAGKTTLIKSVCGIKKIASGCIVFNGQKINELFSDQIIKKGIGICPEGGGCFPKMTVQKNLLLGAFTCSDKNLMRRNYEKVVHLFPILENRKRQQAGLLSGGERQMLAIGRALMANPKLILLDEPSLGLAPLVVNLIFQSLAAIREQGTTALLVEQNAAKSLTLSNRAYVIELGRVVISGTSAELLQNEEVKRAYISM